MHGAFDTSPHRFVAQIFVLAYSFFITISIGGGIMGESYIKQLLDEVEHDIMNYQNQGLCYLPKRKAEADNTDTRF